MAPILLTTPSPGGAGTATPTDDYLDQVEHADQSLDNTDGRWVKLPEALFSSIMAVEPKLNPMYKTSKSLSDEWLRDALRMNDKMAGYWSRLDIAYMSAICAPNADLETLKLMNDWNGWVFTFDDPFDKGDFTNIEATDEVIDTLNMLDSVHPPVSPEDNPPRHTLQSCWMRFSQRASPALQHRWKCQLTRYCKGVLKQVEIQPRSSRLTVKEYMDMRAGCVGVYPCIGLMDPGFKSRFHAGLWVLSLDQSHDKIIVNLVSNRLAEGINLEQALVDLTLQNDLLSYRKDLIQDEKINIIFILKNQGYNDQQAVDQIGEMLYDCYRRWHAALAELPFRQEVIDRDVMKFVEGCRNIALGNLHWSFHTFRYLEQDGPEVKRTRMMKLPHVRGTQNGRELACPRKEEA
ncbi:hypothetical protein MRS44_003777 [Fusarium solani]|uniref:uncharacterized protein n=1 Tax=Fusarium solani TaxID=169388 RepID=UPI0032C48B58|nr:hypothetical protein MRS44_003777 [Fusarium solani]